MSVVARIERSDGWVVVRLGFWERLGAFHRSLDLPRSSVSSAEPCVDLWPQLRGVRWPGTGLPGVIMLGTTRWHGERDFCAVYGHRPGLLLGLEGGVFSRVLLTMPYDEAETLAQNLTG